MRIMLDSTSVIEITSISAMPAWDGTHEISEDNPDMYSIAAVEGGEGIFLGNYKLDGSIETYRAAVKNFEEICENLLTKGYCRISDFKNFEQLL